MTDKQAGTPINYYQKCVDVCRERGWQAILTALTEEGRVDDGTDWMAMYVRFTEAVYPLPSGAAPTGSNSVTIPLENKGQVAQCPHCHGYHVGGCHKSGAAPTPDPFSKGYKNRHGNAVSDACGDEKHGECTQDLTQCHCHVRNGHKTMHAYMSPGQHQGAAPPAATEGVLIDEMDGVRQRALKFLENKGKVKSAEPRVSWGDIASWIAYFVISDRGAAPGTREETPHNHRDPDDRYTGCPGCEARVAAIANYDVRPFHAMTGAHASRVEEWLRSHCKSTADLRWSLYPIGMVQRYIERSESAGTVHLSEAQAEAERQWLELAEILRLEKGDYGEWWIPADPSPRGPYFSILEAAIGLMLFNDELVKSDAAEVERLKQAANLLIDYCVAHEWGLMPEPFDSINPLLKLLDREPRKWERLKSCSECDGDGCAKCNNNEAKK